MKATGSVVNAVLTILASFGVIFSEDVRAIIHDNMVVVVPALFALFSLLPAAWNPFKKKPADPVADPAAAQKGFAAPEMMIAIAIAGAVALLSGCASMGGADVKDMSNEQRVAASLITATAVRGQCFELLEKDRIDVNTAAQCLDFTDQARNAAEMARLAFKAGDAESGKSALAQAESVLKIMQDVHAKLLAGEKPAAPKPAAAVKPVGRVVAI